LLLVEDDEVDRVRFRRAMRGTDMEVEIEECATLVCAAEALRGGPWHWVVTDFELPDGTGRQVMELAGEFAPRAAVVVLTGKGDENLAAHLIRKGARGYLPKDTLESSRLAQTLRAAAGLVDAERMAREITDGYRLLSETGAGLARSRNLDELLDTAARACIPRYADFSILDICLDGVLERTRFADADEQLEVRLRPLVLGPLTQSPADTDPDGSERVVLVDGPYLEELAGRPEALEAFREIGPRHVVRVPLRVGDRRLGTLTFGRAESRFDRLDVLMLNRLGERVALALENARLFHALERALQARDQVLAIVAHDLRNPLGAVSTMVQLLKMGGLSSETAPRTLQTLDTATAQMSRLVDDLVSVAELEQGAVSIRSVKVEPRRLLDDALALVVEDAAARDVRTRAEVPEPCPAIRADPGRTVQILMNLMSNAIRACPAGGTVTIRVGTEPETLPVTAPGPSADRGMLIFVVENEGDPIPEPEIPHLFEPFWQSPTSGRRGRAGLGLAIARGFVERQGGSIGVESRDESTRFWFTLPRFEDPD
jgi:signal transduction histidine kinase/ActR/RegA family two-component response regulator